MMLRKVTRLLAVFSAASICLTGTAVAQVTRDGSSAVVSGHTASNGDPEPNRDMVAPADAKPRSGRSPAADIRVARFDDWTYRCLMAAVPASEADAGDKAEPACEIFQSVLVEQTGGVVEVLNVALSRANDAQERYDWALIVLAPLDVHLPSDFGLSTDDGEPEIVRYRNCNRLGCFVVIPADTALIDRLKRANDGAAHFRLINGQTVKTVFSLIGFTKAFNAMASGEVPDAMPVALTAEEGTEGQ